MHHHRSPKENFFLNQVTTGHDAILKYYDLALEQYLCDGRTIRTKIVTLTDLVAIR